MLVLILSSAGERLEPRPHDGAEAVGAAILGTPKHRGERGAVGGSTRQQLCLVRLHCGTVSWERLLQLRLVESGKLVAHAAEQSRMLQREAVRERRAD